MKQHLSAWIKPFSFADYQRGELLRVLPRRSAKDKEAANCFIGKAQREIEVWLSLDISLLTTAPSEHKTKLERLAKAASEMYAALNNIPADTGAYLHAEIQTTLHCDPYKRYHSKLKWKLEKFGIGNPCDDDFLEELLGVVNESATRMASKYNVRSGPNNERMISLAAKLADHYLSGFQKEPTSGNGSNFRNFMALLSKYLGHEFGAQTVKEALKLRANVRAQMEK